MPRDMNIIVLGLSITSSWGNGHATTYRHLLGALGQRGHRTLFLERDRPWYADHRDLPRPAFGELALYGSLEELQDYFTREILEADLVIVGSYVPQGAEIGRWVTSRATGITAFYDIDTPITLRKLNQNCCDYVTADLIPQYDLYLSFTGGPTLKNLERQYGSPCARPLYCSVDPAQYFAESVEKRYDLGYMGTYSVDRQGPLERLLLDPAMAWPDGTFMVAGPQYPESVFWPTNVRRLDHVPPGEHRTFYNRQRFTLNLTRSDMVQAGYSPSIRLFEAAACGTAIISDRWPGLEEFFEFDTEIFVAGSARDVLRYLRVLSDEDCRNAGRRARQRVLASHTGAHRAIELEQYVDQVARCRVAPASLSTSSWQ